MSVNPKRDSSLKIPNMIAQTSPKSPVCLCVAWGDGRIRHATPHRREVPRISGVKWQLATLNILAGVRPSPEFIVNLLLLRGVGEGRTAALSVSGAQRGHPG